MLIGELCIRDVVIAEPDTRIPQAAKLMRAYHVGDLIVVEEKDGARFPVGIVTDRDLVVGALAEDDMGPIESIRVEDVMSNELVTVREDTDVLDVLKIMRAHGVRRVPVIGSRGELIGVVSFDDLVELVAEQLEDLSALLKREHKHEKEVVGTVTEASEVTRH